MPVSRERTRALLIVVAALGAVALAVLGFVSLGSGAMDPRVAPVDRSATLTDPASTASSGVAAGTDVATPGPDSTAGGGVVTAQGSGTDANGALQSMNAAAAPKPPSTATTSTAAAPATTEVWALTHATVIAPGDAQSTPYGDLVVGRVIRATATTADGESGEFELVLTQHEASSDAPAGTTPGHVYLTGSWVIRPHGAPRSVRHVRGGRRGTLSVESTRDILGSRKSLRATVQALGSGAYGTRASGRGEFIGTARFEGRLTLPRAATATSDSSDGSQHKEVGRS